VDITLNSTLNIDPLKGEKVKLKVGGATRAGSAWICPARWIWCCAGKRSWRRRAAAQYGDESKQLYWPFTGEKQFQADDLQLKFSGKMTDYTLAFRTAVKGQSLPPAKLRWMPKATNSRSISTS
jgi:translocation and assembly module TamB